MTILAQPRKQYSGQGGAGAASSGGGAAGGRILSNHEIAGTVALTQIPDNILILQALMFIHFITLAMRVEQAYYRRWDSFYFFLVV